MGPLGIFVYLGKLVGLYFRLTLQMWRYFLVAKAPLVSLRFGQFATMMMGVGGLFGFVVGLALLPWIGKMAVPVGLGILLTSACSGPLIELSAFRKIGLASLRWPRTEARITRSTVAPMNGGSFHPQVAYTFTVAGHAHVSEKLAFRPLYGGLKKVQALAARYPVGAHVQAAYAPDDPDIAVLEAGPPHLFSVYCIVVPIISLLGLALGLGFIVMGFVLH